MTTILAALAVILILALIATRKPRRAKPDGRDCAPLTRHEREDAWRESFRAEMSLEAYLCTAFRGATAKRRLLQECRNNEGRVLNEIAKRVPVDQRAPTYRIVEHFGVGPRTRRQLEAPPLRTVAPPAPAPVQIIVKRPRAVLTLAR
jgi:hypothetical protein